jgi:hypothetical protein
MGGHTMVLRIRTAGVAVLGSFAMLAAMSSSAQASALSVLPGSCGNQPESQTFLPWKDAAEYTPAPGGNFEAASPAWALTGGAAVASGNESYNVSGKGARALALPAGGSATSPATCTSIYHPTVRFFVRNTGSASSRLTVQALYPGLLGKTQVATVGTISGSSTWQPSPTLGLLVPDLLSTVSLGKTTIAFRFIPADRAGSWQVDDVYIDPFGRSR